MAIVGILSNGVLDLGRWGTLSVWLTHLVVTAPANTTEFPKPWSDSNLVYWLDEQAGNLVIATTTDGEVFGLHLAEPSIGSLVEIDRF
jgi:hypothetical protein